jgi:hypothetical protein
MGISAQTSDMDYSSLALIREDLPAVIKGDLRVNQTSHNPDFDGTYWPDVTGLQHNYYTDVTQRLEKKFFHFFEGQWALELMRVDFGLDGVGVLYVFEDEANAASHYRSRASQYTISSGILSGSARTLLSSTYGDESVGFMAVTRGFESPGRKYIVLMFRVEHIIAKLKLGWYDDAPLEFFYERKDEISPKRKTVFQDDPNVKDAGLIIAENWSERIKKAIGLPPPTG